MHGYALGLHLTCSTDNPLLIPCNMYLNAQVA